MGLMASLSGHRVTAARVSIPQWGCWYADASVDGEHTLSGAVELKIADLTLKGTVLAGGPDKGRSHYRIVGGAGGWGKTLPKKSYASDAGVKVLTVLIDAAKAAGESIDSSTVDSSKRTGPAFVRREGRAAWALERLAPSAWYVGENGITRLGKRPTTSLSAKATHGPVDRARGTVTLAAESIATILPGVVVDGLEAVDVQHEISKDGLRSTIWGARASHNSRLVTAIREIVEQLDPDRAYRAVYEYRVVTQSGERLNLQPVLVSTGMPSLERVPVRPGVSGCRSDVMLGSRVLVGFINADPGRPYVAAFESADGEGFTPILTEIDAQTLLKLAGGADFVALSTQVSAQLALIATALSTHVHSGVTTGPGVSGTAAPVYVPGPVAAAKVKAT